MMTKTELITYIKKNDRYYRNMYLDDYPQEILLALKKIIESHLKGLPKGFMLYSNGYDKELEEIEILKKYEN